MSLPTVPKTSPILLDAYNTLNSLILPPPSEFTYPLVESFAAVHDPLTEGHGKKIFTASMTLREAGVQVERATRELSKVYGEGVKPGAEDDEAQASAPPMLSLTEVKKSRLRTKLQSQAKLQTPSPVPISEEALRRAVQERRARFDAEMGREEEEALEEFKRGLREAVLLAPGI